MARFTVAEIADYYLNQVKANRPELYEKFQDWDDESIVSHLLKDNPEVALKIDLGGKFEKLGYSVYGALNQLKPAGGAALQAVTVAAKTPGVMMEKSPFVRSVEDMPQWKQEYLKEYYSKDEMPMTWQAVSYTHLTLPTNREV